jgi:hypothetical protein
MRVLTIFAALFSFACGNNAPPPGGPTAPGGACTAMTTATCMGACQVCVLPHDDMGIQFDNGKCGELCTNPGGSCADGVKKCTLLMDVPAHGADYNDSGDCDSTKTAVCL